MMSSTASISFRMACFRGREGGREGGREEGYVDKYILVLRSLEEGREGGLGGARLLLSTSVCRLRGI